MEHTTVTSSEGLIYLDFSSISQTYMKRSLPVDIGAVNITFLVDQKSYYIMHVSMIDWMEHDVISNLLHGGSHFCFKYLIID